MELTPEQFARIVPHLPRQRGNVSHENLNVINAILFVAENGCKWRALPKRFGNWHTIYTRMNRWAKAGVLDRMFEKLQQGDFGKRNLLTRRVAGTWTVAAVLDWEFAAAGGVAAPGSRSRLNRPV